MSNAKGMGTKFDQFSGEWLERQRKYGERTGVFLAFQKRFCETCKQRKPKDSTKAMKGWMCADCRKTKKKPYEQA